MEPFHPTLQTLRPREPRRQGSWRLDASLCAGCGACVDVCSVHALGMGADGRPCMVQEEGCCHCQHCVALCPAGALSIDGRPPAQALETPRLPPLEGMEALVRHRRSVRRYAQANVDPALLRRLLEAMAHAPTGMNGRQLTATVIDDLAVMDRFRRRYLEHLDEAARLGRLEGAFPFLQMAGEAFRATGEDAVFRGAPHLLVLSSPLQYAAPKDILIALTTFELLAQAAGLGTVWCGGFSTALDTLPETKAWLGLPEDHAHYAMAFGHPDIHYARPAQRTGDLEVRRLRG